MDIASLSKVECTILHNQFHPLDSTVAIEAVQNLAAKLKYAPEVQVMDMTASTEITVHVGGHRVLIRQVPEPVSQSTFKGALTTPYTHMIFPNVHEMVFAHQAHSTISISRGLYDLSPEAALFREATVATNCFNTSQEVNRAMLFCLELVKLLMANNPATAIHWCPSNNLVSQDFFERNSAGDRMLLNVRPTLSSSSSNIEDGKPFGMTLAGSQWLIGRIVEFEESPVSFPWMMEAALSFLKMSQKNGALPSNMETYTLFGKDWRVGMILEERTAQEHWDKVKLVPVHVPEFGILGETEVRFDLNSRNVATVWPEFDLQMQEIVVANEVLGDEPSMLNPVDTMDSAILDRLNKRQVTDGYQVVESSSRDASVPVTKVSDDASSGLSENTDFKPKHEPWTGARQKANLDVLRELAKASLERKEDDARGSLMGKLGGMFGKK